MTKQAVTKQQALGNLLWAVWRCSEAGIKINITPFYQPFQEGSAIVLSDTKFDPTLLEFQAEADAKSQPA